MGILETVILAIVGIAGLILGGWAGRKAGKSEGRKEGKRDMAEAIAKADDAKAERIKDDLEDSRSHADWRDRLDRVRSDGDK